MNSRGLMSVKLRIKNNRIYLDVYHNGRRKWEALNISLSDDKDTNREILRIAEICRAKREMQILTASWGVADPVGGSMSLYSYLEKLQKRAGTSAKQNITKSKKHLKNFPGGEVIQLKQITSAWVQKLHDYLKKDCGLKQSSSRTYEAEIRQAIRTAYKENLIPLDPTIGVKTIKPNEPNKIFLNMDEVRKLANAKIREQWEVIKRAFLFGCNTGLRVSDLIALEWGNIEREPLQVIIRQKKTESLVYIPLNDTAWNLINDNKAHNAKDKIFPCLTSGCHYAIFKKWEKAAGITKRIGWHTARHTFAVMSLENGVDIYTLSKLLGHRDIATTQVYAKATDKMKRAAVNALPELWVN